MMILLLMVFVLCMGMPMPGIADCGAVHSMYVPRQLSYNPILENALIYNKKNRKVNRPSHAMHSSLETEIDARSLPLVLSHSEIEKRIESADAQSVDPAQPERIESADAESIGSAQPKSHSYEKVKAKSYSDSYDWNYLFSVKPIYTQTISKSLKKYFNINHKACMQVREDGTGDIDSLWLQTISSDPTFYSSTLSFSPVSKTGGVLLFFQAQLPHELSVSVDTAVVHVSNDMRLLETNITNLGTSEFQTVTQEFASPINCFGRVCCARGKTGLDDIQVKLMYNLSDCDEHHFDVYGLLGIPTGAGSKSRYLFEPLVGSKHVQLGLGATGMGMVCDTGCSTLSLQGELKWRYGFAGKEIRSFDLTKNGQWSRYMLLVKRTDLVTMLPAINSLTFKSSVTPRNSVDLYFAAHYNYNAWHAEVGYDFWYRSPEHVCIKNCNSVLSTFGIADLLGIALLNPHTASTANISQSVAAGANQMVSDTTFVGLTTADINPASGAAPRSMSNCVYASVGYELDCHEYPMELGLNVAYEKGTNNNKADTVSGWLSFDIYI